MEILYLIILEKLREKYGEKPINFKDIKKELSLVHRIPKPMIDLIISDLLSNNYLIKCEINRHYLLCKDIDTYLNWAKDKYNSIRNKQF
jgi:hypothetical protein